MNTLFQVHLLNPAGIEKATAIATAFENLLIALEAVCPESREFSLTKTKLEEASFFAKKAMANVPENQS